MSKESRRKRGELYAQYKQARDNKSKAFVYTQKRFKHIASIASGNDAAATKQIKKAQILADPATYLTKWRSSGAETKPWGVYYHNTLDNRPKDSIIRYIYDLNKEGLIDLKKLGLSISAESYNDVVDWGLESLNDEQLLDIVADAETRDNMIEIDFETGRRKF